MHRSQMSAAERARARIARERAAGVANLQGGRSHFTQGRGTAPAEGEAERAVKWNRGLEQSGTITHTWPEKFIKPDETLVDPSPPGPLRLNR